MRLAGIAVILAAFGLTGCAASDVTLVKDGTAKAAIVVAQGVMAPDAKVDPQASYEQSESEMGRRLVRESVNDLALYLEKISGAKVEILAEPPRDARIPVYVGKMATDLFGPPAASDEVAQGWRMVVRPDAVGLLGESDLATSYAIYELLHRLGCRWYMPSELGECIPRMPTVQLKISDTSSVPSTLSRQIWYADDAFKRRNRQGGIFLMANHAFEYYITEEDRKQHPEWRATIDGKPHFLAVTWTRPEVRETVANRIIEKLDKRYQPSISLSPKDGARWDEAYDPRYDATDWDPAMDTVSKTDRLLVAVNDIVSKVNAKYPKVIFGMIAYVDYTRPPVREKVNPNLIPEIAPITYNRAHPMTAQGHPNGFALKELVEGWAKVAPRMADYWFAYNLAESSAPNPFITKFSTDIPILLKNNCKFWQPETMANFETTMIGLNIGMRLSWDASQKPEEIVAEIMTNFYGAAADPMSRYWHLIDQAWQTNEYAGGGFGYSRIFTPEVMKKARALMDEALAACRTTMEFQRVQLANESLTNFERFMKMRTELADGRLENLQKDVETWRGYGIHLEEKYRAQSCFGYSRGLAWPVYYFDLFFGKTYLDGARIARDFTLLTPGKPLRLWKYQTDKESQGEAQGWQKSDFSDAGWKSTDVGVETWSSIGRHNYMGKMWYRISPTLPQIPAGKKVYLWLPSTEGKVKLFVNGETVPFINEKGESAETFEGFCQPVSFDITKLAKPGEKNQITLLFERKFIDEVGVGGLLAPPMIYREK